MLVVHSGISHHMSLMFPVGLGTDQYRWPLRQTKHEIIVHTHMPQCVPHPHKHPFEGIGYWDNFEEDIMQRSRTLLDFLILIFWFRVVFIWHYMSFHSVMPLMILNWIWNTPFKELSRKQPQTRWTALCSESNPEGPFQPVSWLLFLLLKLPGEHQLIWQRPFPCQAFTRSPFWRRCTLSLVPPDTGWDWVPPRSHWNQDAVTLIDLAQSLLLLGFCLPDYQITLTVGASRPWNVVI